MSKTKERVDTNFFIIPLDFICYDSDGEKGRGVPVILSKSSLKEFSKEVKIEDFNVKVKFSYTDKKTDVQKEMLEHLDYMYSLSRYQIQLIVNIKSDEPLEIEDALKKRHTLSHEIYRNIVLAFILSSSKSSIIKLGSKKDSYTKVHNYGKFSDHMFFPASFIKFHKEGYWSKYYSGVRNTVTQNSCLRINPCSVNEFFKLFAILMKKDNFLDAYHLLIQIYLQPQIRTANFRISLIILVTCLDQLFGDSRLRRKFAEESKILYNMTKVRNAVTHPEDYNIYLDERTYIAKKGNEEWNLTVKDREKVKLFLLEMVKKKVLKENFSVGDYVSNTNNPIENIAK